MKKHAEGLCAHKDYDARDLTLRNCWRQAKLPYAGDVVKGWDNMQLRQQLACHRRQLDMCDIRTVRTTTPCVQHKALHRWLCTIQREYPSATICLQALMLSTCKARRQHTIHGKRLTATASTSYIEHTRMSTALRIMRTMTESTICWINGLRSTNCNGLMSSSCTATTTSNSTLLLCLQCSLCLMTPVTFAALSVWRSENHVWCE